VYTAKSVVSGQLDAIPVIGFSLFGLYKHTTGVTDKTQPDVRDL